MTWFRVDDSFDGHPKVLAAGNAAIGLWTKCGTYCARHNSDGFVPKSVANRAGRWREIRSLCGAGLWTEVVVKKADGSARLIGYQMHDFLDYNPSAEQVKHEREAAASRRRAWRDRQRDATPYATRDATQPRPDPTRPDPLYTSEDDLETVRASDFSSSSSFHNTLELVIDALELNSRPIGSRPAYRAGIRRNVIVERGDTIRDALHQGLTPIAAAAIALDWHPHSSPAPPTRDVVADQARSAAAAHILTGNTPDDAYRQALDSYPDHELAIVEQIQFDHPDWSPL